MKLVRIKEIAISKLTNLKKNCDGASLVEYALLVALIAIVAIAAITTLGTKVSSQFSNIASGVG